MTVANALARRTLADVRIRTAAFAYIFGASAFGVAWGYRSSYPTRAERLELIRTFANNAAARLFYGMPHRLETVGGFAAWRAGGLIAVFSGLFGALLAARVFRGEEEAGRYELVAAGAIGRSTAFAARTGAIAASLLAVWFVTALGFVAGRLPVGGAAFLAVASLSPAAVYAGLGALAGQLLPTRRSVLATVGLALGGDLLLRAAADTTDTTALHWLSPLGWAEELRPFSDSKPAVLALPLLASLGLLGAAAYLERRRDIGGSLLALADSRSPRTALLGSPALLVVRRQRGTTIAWLAGVAGFALVVGSIAKTVASGGYSRQLREQVHKLGSADLTSAEGYLGLTFLFFALAIALYCCAQVAAAAEEEAEGRAEALLAHSLARSRWLGARLLLAAGGAAALGLTAGAGAAAGARAAGTDVSVPTLLGAGLNVLPPALVFLGVGSLLYAFSAREGAATAYALVGLAFVWELVGAMLDAPAWLLGVSPFHQLALVPAAPFRPVATLAMLLVACAAAGAALVRFRTRDLAGG